jgi:Ubiquitin carboxyl-terminal hydrolase
MTAQHREHGKESNTARSVHFQKVIITSSLQRFKPKILPPDTVVAVDKHKFYFGSYTTAWKDVDMMMIEDTGFNFKDTKEHRVMECKGPLQGGSSKDYKAFQQFVQRKWQKQQTKKDRELARERSNLPNNNNNKARPKQPTNKVYGSRNNRNKTSHNKTNLTSSWGTRDDDDSEYDTEGDTFHSTHKTWKQQQNEQKKKQLLGKQDSFGIMNEAEEEDNDPVATIVEEEDNDQNVASDTEEDVTDDVQVVQEDPVEHSFTSNTKTPKPKGRLVGKKLRKLLPSAGPKKKDYFSDSDDDELFRTEDPKLTTPAAEAQVVTPAERYGRHDDETTDTEIETETAAASSSTKPKQQGTLDSFFQPRRNLKAPDRSAEKSTRADIAAGKKTDHVSPKVTTLTASPKATFFPPASPTTAKLTVSPLRSFFVSSNLLSPKATMSPTTNFNLTPSDNRTATTPTAPPTTLSKSRTILKRSICDMPDISDDDDPGFGPSSSSEPKITDSLSSLPPPSHKRNLPRRQLGRNVRPRGSLLGRSDNSPSDTSPRRLPWREESKTEITTSISDDCPYRGLQNNGNSCYLNSSLQMLFTVKPFVDSIQGKGKNLVRSIVSTAREVADMTKSFAARAYNVKAALDRKTDKFRGTRQHDAHELVGELIDIIHEELEEERNERQKQQDESKPVTNATTDDGKPKGTETSPPGDRAGIDNVVDMTFPATEPTKASPSKETDKYVDGSRNFSIGAGDSMPLGEESRSSVSTPTLELADDDCLAGELARNEASDDAPTENEATKSQFPTDEFFRCDIEVCLKCKACGYSR